MEVMASSIKTLNVLKSDKIACPKCDPTFKFYRCERPFIDGCGFESYSVRCGGCGLTFVGIVDPRDDKLLLTISS
jgi:hypothetical protein